MTINLNIMELFLEIIKILIPTLIVFLTSIFTIKYFLEDDQKKRRMEMRMLNQKTITPIRLQAYERLVIFLERIAPESMLMRLSLKNKNVAMIQLELVRLIRAEYEHNLSQQVYISSKAWEVIKTSKESTIKLINTTALKMKPSDPAQKFSTVLLESLMEKDQITPSKVALSFIKNEIQQIF